MRGLAVALVVLYHAGVPWLSGGFIGVDVFFVLSGFLITGLLVDELRRNGTVSLRRFYARRVRRLLPHGTLVLVVTAVAAFYLLPPLDQPEAAKDISAAGLFAANWHFAAEATDYFTAGAKSPVLHYWSLSVEEQFYVLWPLLILAVARGRIALRRWDVAVRRLALALTVLGIASFLVSWLTTEASGAYGYFGVHTRAFELVAGGAVALARPTLRHLPRLAAVLTGWFGLFLIVYSGLAFSETTVFPGAAAALPVLGTALLVLAGVRLPEAAASRLMSLRPLTWLGRHSYGLYLWHWPCLVFLWLHYDAGGDPADAGESTAVPVYATIAVLVLAMALAVVAARLIETPIRTSKRLARATGMSLALGVTLVASAVVLPSAALSAAPESAVPTALRVLGAMASGGDVRSSVQSGPDTTDPKAIPVSRAKAAAARLDIPVVEGCTAPRGVVEVGRDQDCFFGDASASRTIALIGDSHARSLFPAFDRYAKKESLRLFFVSKDSCPMADVVTIAPPIMEAYHQCPPWREDVLERLSRVEDLEAVYLVRASQAANWVLGPDGEVYERDSAGPVWRDALDLLLTRILEETPRVVLLRDIPRADGDVPACLSRHHSDARKCSFDLAKGIRDGHLTGGEDEIAHNRSGVVTADISSTVCSASPCQVVSPGGKVIYRDSHHLTGTFSRAIASKVAPILTEARTVKD